MIFFSSSHFCFKIPIENQRILKRIYPRDKDEYKNRKYAKLAYIGRIFQKIVKMISKTLSIPFVNYFLTQNLKATDRIILESMS